MDDSLLGLFYRRRLPGGIGGAAKVLDMTEGISLALLLAAEGEMSRSRFAELLGLAGDWTPPVFPIDFTADRAACLARLKELTESTH